MTKEQLTKILIVEDEIIIADYISELLKEEHFNNVKIANDAQTARGLMTSFLPDIILMDINLNGKNTGIELSEAKNENATVIFITGQQDFALMSQAIRTKPNGYLTKPIKKVEVIAAISLVAQKRETQTLQIKDGYDIVNLEYNSINYIEADGNYVNIYTTSKKYTVRQSLNTIVEQLPTDIFVQTHRSYLVNRTKIQRLTASSVFVNNIEISLSRTFAKRLK
ncbi:LytR/AlgR family response regulator transcription factor [Winogradskyella sp. SM1960]|uniref:LytR/AlgR family response regulator transcription factor n=1 Tax=Winogradskyella sp. SM1960 TaxID=2865955 RepID=UPI001CD43D42|nr:LytTR family DNA-binding domain-containing protein [Winogradskyella sp. SM1960]